MKISKRIITSLLTAALCASLCSCSILKEVTAKPQEKQEGLYFSLSKLPDTGEYNEKGKVKYFFPEGAKKSFEPGADYGKIVPYIAGTNRYTPVEEWDEEFFTGEDFNLYGLATTDGKIITDGIFSSGYIAGTLNSKNYYILKRNFESPESYNKQCDIVSETGDVLISASASELDDIRFLNNMPIDCVLVAAQDGDEIYNDRGELLINLKEAFGADAYFNVYYADGEKFIIRAASYSGDENFENYYCINKSGTLLYELDWGGFDEITYCDGLFLLVDFDSDITVYSDIYGKIVETEKEYSELVYVKSERNIWGLAKGESRLDKLSADGECLESVNLDVGETAGLNILRTKTGNTLLISSFDDDLYKKFFVYNCETSEKKELNDKAAGSYEIITRDDTDYILLRYENETDVYDAEGTYLSTFDNNLAGENITMDGKLLYFDEDIKLHIMNLFDSKKTVIETGLKEAPEYYYLLELGDTRILRIEDDKEIIINLTTGETIWDGESYPEIMELGNHLYVAGEKNGRFVLINEKGETLISIINKSNA